MSQRNDNLELLLAKLGEARQNDVFQSEAGRCPWLSDEHDGSHLTARRFAWARIAIPLTAAAAVGVLFVGPSLWSPRVIDNVAMSTLTSDKCAKPAHSDAITEVPTTVEASNCDYNGDGVVDGKDIQAFVDRLKDIKGDPKLEMEQLQRCLLSGDN